MNLLNMIFMSIRKSKLAFFMTIIEIAALLLTVNISVSTISERNMLNNAYYEVLSDNSVFVWDTNYAQNKISGLAKNREQSRELILNDLEGEYKVYDSIFFEGPSPDNVTIIALSDEIYDKLALPLMSGNYNGAVASFGSKTGKFGYKFSTDSQEDLSIDLEITGILTSNTFLPLMRSYSSGNDFTIKNFYITSDNYKNFIITRKSSVEGYESQFSPEMGFVLQFNDSNYNRNVEILSSKVGVTEGGAVLENTQKELLEDLRNFIPLLICVSLAVIIGTVSISVIMNSKSEYRNGVLWICGYSRRKILFFHFFSMIFMFIISAIIYVCVYLTLSLFKIEFFTSASFSAANIFATVIVCAVLIALSMIIPIARSKKSSPVEYLRRAK